MVVLRTKCRKISQCESKKMDTLFSLLVKNEQAVAQIQFTQ